METSALLLSHMSEIADAFLRTWPPKMKWCRVGWLEMFCLRWFRSLLKLKVMFKISKVFYSSKVVEFTILFGRLNFIHHFFRFLLMSVFVQVVLKIIMHISVVWYSSIKCCVFIALAARYSWFCTALLIC